LNEISQETERVLSETELKELRSRLAVLENELSEKSQLIESVTYEKQDLDRTLERLQKAEAATITSDTKNKDIQVQSA
jgi:hypothetical protein